MPNEHLIVLNCRKKLSPPSQSFVPSVPNATIFQTIAITKGSGNNNNQAEIEQFDFGLM